MPRMTKKRLPLPVRRSMNLTDKAYDRLRQLNDDYGLGNNYLLVVLLENLDEIAAHGKIEEVYQRFIAEYGSPDS